MTNYILAFAILVGLGMILFGGIVITIPDVISTLWNAGNNDTTTAADAELAGHSCIIGGIALIIGGIAIKLKFG